ncbi:hypothetical protein LCGC14_0843590 [marine sediment metagenome]|uniref:Sulfotransferase domain-containing protein n=1 Tax=marine sediment metagenome TaxID=412755 RepID=A0A0F9PH61_9ZZZZ
MKWDCDFKPCICPNVSFVHYNEKERVVYYETPRCASSSIKKTLESFDAPRIAGLFRPCDVGNENDVPEDCFSFTVVRNPWKRVVSNYLLVSYRKAYKSRLDIGNALFGKIKSFEDFVIRMFNEGCRNHHWAPCIRFLPKDLNTLDFVLRFETLAKDWEELRTKVGCLDELHGHSGPRLLPESERDYTELYKDSKIVDLVAEYYAEDIEAFGFEFGK